MLNCYFHSLLNGAHRIDTCTFVVVWKLSVVFKVFIESAVEKIIGVAVTSRPMNSNKTPVYSLI